MIDAHRERLLPAIVVAFAIFGVIGITARYTILHAVVEGYEDVSLSLLPSASRAYAYGEGHFSASYPDMYNINRAEHLFNEVRRIDPQHPFVYHQLARIAFLKGDFTRAHALIDAQIRYHGSTTPSSYYVRGLIEGYMGRYEEAAKDYETYLESDPNNWAALNDYAWVLLKVGRSADAIVAAERGLKYFPNNAWLLNSSAIALYEIGELSQAQGRAEAAVAVSEAVTEKDWLLAYPGNDPKVAKAGIVSLQKASRDNMHTILLALASSTLQ